MTEMFRQAHELTPGMEIRSKAGVWNVITDIDPDDDGSGINIIGLANAKPTIVTSTQEVMSRGGQ
jgi:hypothetical protein